jgi:5-methylcytosine-specific restriction endonuclease McrA
VTDRSHAVLAESIDRLWLLAGGHISAMPADRLDSDWEKRLTIIAEDINGLVRIVRAGQLPNFPAYADGWIAALNILLGVVAEVIEAFPVPTPEASVNRVQSDALYVRDWLTQIAEQYWGGPAVVPIRSSGVDASSKRAPVVGELRAIVWSKSGGRCWYCGKQTNPFRDFHVDHVVPVSAGGSGEIANLVPSCQPCNNAKHAKSLEAFRFACGGALFWFEIVRSGAEP